MATAPARLLLPEPPTTVHVERISVSYEYPVYFTSDVFSPDNPHFREAVSRREPSRRHRLFVAIDGGLAEHWPALASDVGAYVERHADRLGLAGEPVLVEGGEAAKNDPAAVAGLHARLDALALDRQSFVVAVGGGAVLDLVGYAAATVHRGIRVVRLPTTVLAQCDSGVGVKNGVNAFGKKNLLGTFAPPFAVLNDRRFLRTLARRDAIAGMAEAVKVALVRDAAFFDWIASHAAALAACEPGPVADLVARAARLHLRHIATSGDPFELGSARPLDFGHWAAHKLESLTRHRLGHGEAVAIGLALDSAYSVGVGLLAAADLERVAGLLERLGLRLWDEALGHAGPDGRPPVLEGLSEFREHLGGELTVTLLAGLGHGVEVHEIDEAGVLRAIDWLRRRDAAR